MNNKFKVRFKDFNQVKAFIVCASECPCDINVSTDNFKRSIVDGKSIMGVIAICSGGDLTVQLLTDDENIIHNFKYEIAPYIVGE